MDKGFTKKEAMEIEKKVKEKGWKVEEDKLYAIKKDNSAWWWQYTGSSIFTIAKGKKEYRIVVLGDIEINDPKNKNIYFYFRGGSPETGDNADLTDHLVKYGDYEHNNWFEVVEEDDDEDIDPDWDLMEGSLKDVVQDLFEEANIE